MKRLNVLITAGGTREPIDAVRYIGNRSSGRMAAAVAEACLAEGHAVTAVCAAMSVEMPPVVRVVRVETTRELRDATLAEWPLHDALVMAAAVADFRPEQVSDVKIRRDVALTLRLVPTEDVLAAACAAKRDGQFVVGFSLDDDDIDALERARAKMGRKGCDWIVYNPIATLDDGRVEATLLSRAGETVTLPAMDKRALAASLASLLTTGTSG